MGYLKESFLTFSKKFSLARRMSWILPRIIFKEQGAFVKGLTIVEKISLAHEVALSDRGFKPKGLIGGRGVKKNSGYGKSIFLDRMGFLGVIFFLNFGFCDKWRNLIHGCLCNENFGVLVDGVPHGYFPASRGLRQGFQT